MPKLTILNTREIKKLREAIIAQFDYFLEEDFAFLQNEKGRVFIINKDLSKVNLNNLKIDKIGLYFAEVKETQVRLSKEGAQLLGIEARKKGKELQNTVILTEAEISDYFKGNDLTKDLGESKLILLQYGDDILGCAKYKEGKILNFLPKIHRGEVIA